MLRELLLALAAVLLSTGEKLTVASASETAVSDRTLEALPGVTIHYYDVTGANLSIVNSSIAANAPRDRASNAMSVSSSEWNLNVKFGQRITDGQCVITGAEAQFTGVATLPRLAKTDALPRDQRKVWDQFVSNLSSYEAAKLWFVYDRVVEIERAIMNSSCSSASRAAAATAERIERQLEVFARSKKRPSPTFKVPVRDPSDPRG